MTRGEKLRQASARVVSKFANKGALLKPTSDDYDPGTGVQDTQPDRFDLEYVTVTDKTNKDTSLKATSFRESVVWFTTSIQLIVNETWVIEGINAEKYDIITLEKVVVNDVIVGYYALIKVRL